MQYSQLLLRFVAQCSIMTKSPVPGASTHLMTNIKKCYDNVLAQSTSITELLLEGRYVDWKHCDIKKFSSKVDSTKVVLNRTNAT